uniref:Retrotransposon gag domain-containing protein n=1 Tax=Tanacetum cinerariifolium TaxID=118510 RepID=A0A6L2N6S1_TANCI|nr:hypothetical protein [Tanacetum cinerariifolium]
MAELISEEYIVNAQNESNLSITSKDINIELNNEFLVKLQKNAYHGLINEYVVNHIAKVLEMIDLIYIPGVDSHQLRMKVFPLSLVDDARQWWINEGKKITIWEELVKKFFCKLYPKSYDGEEEMLDEGDNWGIYPLEFISRVNSSFDKDMKMDGRTKKVLFHAWKNGSWNKRRMDDRILSSNNTTTDSFFRPYLKTSEKNETKKDNELSLTKRKFSNTSNSVDEQPYKKICKAEKFEAIKYSLRPNEDRMSIIYKEFSRRRTKDGWRQLRMLFNFIESVFPDINTAYPLHTIRHTKVDWQDDPLHETEDLFVGLDQLIQLVVSQNNVHEGVAEEVIKMANDQAEALSFDKEVTNECLVDEQVGESRPSKKIRVTQEEMIKDQKSKKT